MLSRSELTLVRSLLLCSLFVLSAARSEASCDVIPGANDVFRGALGQTDRPFAGPGDIVGLSVEPGICDARSLGFVDRPGGGTLADDYVVTLLFTPPSGRRTGVVLATNCGAVAPKLAACGAAIGGTASCIPANVGGGPIDLQVVDSLHMTFRFPNTSAQTPASADGLATLSGPVKIVVSPASDPVLPCQLATQPCAGVASGLSACIDQLYREDGTCRTSPSDVDSAFGNFTALPVQNEYGAMVAGSTGVRFTTDAAGNALLPVDWRAVLVRVDGTPYPRLVRGTTTLPAFSLGGNAIRLPGASAISAWAPNGIRLPPVFTPLSDPTEQDLALFGTVDAPRAITRIARRLPVTSRCFAGSVPGAVCVSAAQCPAAERCQPIATPEFRECTAGANAGLPCLLDSDCPGDVCGPTSCRGGSNGGAACSVDSQCGGGECGPSLFDFSSRYAANVGPVLIDSSAYAVEVQQPATLEGQTETEALLAFVTPEGLTGTDANGDTDNADPVLTLRSKTSGDVQAIGDAGSPGRAITRVSKPPFRFSALAAEKDIVAYLEPEQQQGQCFTPTVCDQNSDGELLDTLLRVYKLGGAPIWTQPLSVDADPVIDGRSLAVSEGLVFFRRPEWGDAPVHIRAASTDENGNFTTTFPADAINLPTLTDSGRHTCFMTDANLVASDTNGRPDVYCRDLQTGALVRESVTPTGGDPDGFGDRVNVSGDGRYVVFESAASNLTDPPGTFELFLRDRDTDGDGRFDEPGATRTVGMPTAPAGVLGPPTENVIVSRNGRHILFPSGSAGTSLWVYDRDTDANGVFDEPGTTAFQRVDVSGAGVPANDLSRRPSMSADGRHIAFQSLAFNLLVGEDNNSAMDVFVHDRDTDGDGIFDEPGAMRTVRISVGTTGEQVVGGGQIGDSTSAISADGRFVTFESVAALTPGVISGGTQTYVYDRDPDEDGIFDEPGSFTVTLASAVSGSEQSADTGFGMHGALSPDGRYVAFVEDQGLVGWPSTAVGFYGDRYVRDRITGLTHPFGMPSLGVIPDYPTIGLHFYAKVSAYGRQFAYKSLASNLLPGDTNGVGDLFVEGVDFQDPVRDLTGEGVIDDFVLSTIDALAVSHQPVALRAASQASVASGNAAFLQPEPGVVRRGNDVNGDGDTSDQVVQLYRNRQGVTNLSLAATKVAISRDIVAALASEKNQEADLNGDSDRDDRVVEVNPVSSATAASWTSAGVAADSLGVAGPHAAFIAPEAQQGPSGNDASEDGDVSDRTMQCYDASGSQLLSITNPQCLVQGTGAFAACSSNPTRSLPAEEFVVGDEVLAFRSRELSLCNASFTSCVLNSCPREVCDLNGDGDCCDDVLLGYDFQEKRLVSSKSTVVPCPFEACDPRTPYKVAGTTVRFIEFEGPADLNGNGLVNEFLVQLFNVRSGGTTTIGVATPDPPSTGLPAEGFDSADPFGDPSPPPGTPQGEGTASVMHSKGRCVETLPIACSEPNGCGPGQFCDLASNACMADHGTCTVAADCPAGSNAVCRDEVVTQTASDSDGDAIIDPIDNCPTVANANQADFDRDGVGDACDLSTCGDGSLAKDPGSNAPLEECDDNNLVAGDGCSPECRIEPPAVCDVNADLRIDQLDIDAIFAARGLSPSGLDDPRDANHDGTLSVLDARSCTKQCTAPKCALASHACGLLGIEVVIVFGFAALKRRTLEMWRRV